LDDLFYLLPVRAQIGCLIVIVLALALAFWAYS
jgi:hypothetical protein